MATKWVNEVLAHSPQKGTAKLVLVAYAWKANEEGVAWPSNETIAGICGVSDRQVRTIVDRLVEDGELTILDPGGRGPTDTRKVQIRRNSTSTIKTEAHFHHKKQKRRKSTSTDKVKGKRQGSNRTAKPSPSLQPWTAWTERFYETFAEQHPDHLPDDYRSKAGREKLISKGADALRKLHHLRKVPKPEISAILKYLMFEDDFYLPQGNMKTLHKLDARTRDGSQRHYEVIRSKMKRKPATPQVGIIPHRDA